MWRRISVAATLFVLSGCFQGCGQPSPWCGPAPEVGASLWGASAITASDIWAVGGYQDSGFSGGLLTEHWDGQRWTAVQAPVGPWDKGADLLAVSAAGSRDVWAVGQGHKNGQNGTLIEHWDGSIWAVVNSPSPGNIDNHLTAVDAISKDEAWAVGDYFGPTYQPLIEHWNGAAWSVVDAATQGTAIIRLYAVAAVDGNNAWAVGSRRDSDSAPFHTLIEHWDGAAWQVVASPNPRGGQLSSVRALSINDVWAVGTDQDGPLTEHWDGFSWTVIPSPKIPNVRVQTIAAAGPDDVWIAGASTQDWLILHWDGNRWTTTAPGAHSTGVVNAVTAQQGSVWAVGNHRASSCGPDWALIERWDGKGWSYVHSPHDGPAS
jgi:hypothetical protein